MLWLRTLDLERALILWVCLIQIQLLLDCELALELVRRSILKLAE